jgi:REase_DpnII-MboI
MKVSELIVALEEFQTKLAEHEALLEKRAGQRAELSESEKQTALQEQSRWLSRRLGALRPHIERFDSEWMMQHPATGVTLDALDVATSLTGHPGTKHSFRQVFSKLHRILGRLEALDPNEEIPADRGESAQDEWISASSAVALLGRRTICQGAYAGPIRARAKRFIRNGQVVDNVEIPREFWWAKGERALTQNWAAGNFDTWPPDSGIHLEAFGVTFRRADTEASRPATLAANNGSPTTSTHRNPSGAKGRDVIFMLAERFHGVVRQLRERHDSRPTLAVADEYDVQDLFHALLSIYFDDIRAEEWAPSYAGGASRMDFL